MTKRILTCIANRAGEGGPRPAAETSWGYFRFAVGEELFWNDFRSGKVGFGDAVAVGFGNFGDDHVVGIVTGELPDLSEWTAFSYVFQLITAISPGEMRDLTQRHPDDYLWSADPQRIVATICRVVPADCASSMALIRVQSGLFDEMDPLTAAFYDLLRDEVPAGRVEEVVEEMEREFAVDGLSFGDVREAAVSFSGRNSLWPVLDLLSGSIVFKYTNGHLARYARDLSRRLRAMVLVGEDSRDG
jgi:hypothetical protein